MTTSLLDEVLEAHGGLERWNSLEKASAMFISTGGLIPLKGGQANTTPRKGTASIHEQRTVVDPFLRPDWRMVFTPDRVAIETQDGALVQERLNPRAAFEGHTLTTFWDPLHLAYFNGYARWTYLNTPFLLARPRVEVTEIKPWTEGAERWRGLRAAFPDSFASHSRVMEFYFGDDRLLRRHDYRLEIGGSPRIAQYVHDLVKTDGFWFPTKRRAYARAIDRSPIRDVLLISIDLGDYSFI
jgi:hypothetical protein